MYTNKTNKFIYSWPKWSQLWVIGSWWHVRNLHNIKMIHYNELLHDLPGMMRDIVEYLDIEIDEDNFDHLVEKCTFNSMKSRADDAPEFAQLVFKDISQYFFKGHGGRWKDTLTHADTEEYRNVARRYFDDDCIYWLEHGEYRESKKWSLDSY